MIPSPENHSLTIFLSRILHDFLSEKMCIPCIPQKYLKLNKVSHGVWKLVKVSFNITSEASYVHVLSGQKLIKKKPNIWSILWGFDEIFLGDFPTMCVSCNSCQKVSSPSRLSLDLWGWRVQNVVI